MKAHLETADTPFRHYASALRQRSIGRPLWAPALALMAIVMAVAAVGTASATGSVECHICDSDWDRCNRDVDNEAASCFAAADAFFAEHCELPGGGVDAFCSETYDEMWWNCHDSRITEYMVCDIKYGICQSECIECEDPPAE